MTKDLGISELNFDQFVKKYQRVPVKEYPNCVSDSLPSPEITVRVITFQHAPYIRKCLEGILMQETEIPFEIVIGEDDSTDGTKEICIEYAKRYPDKIRLFLNDRKNNIQFMGSPTARFNVVYTKLKSRGRLSAFCEGDDYWTDPQKLEKQYRLMEKHPECNLSFHPALIEWGSDKKRAEIFKRHKDHNHIYTVSDIIEGGGEFCPSNSLMVRGNVESVYEWQLQTPVGDYFSQVLASLNGGALYINDVMSVYRKKVPGSWSKRKNSFLERAEHMIHMCRGMHILDRQTGYRYHKSFRNRENFVLKKYAVFPAFSYGNETVKELLKLIRVIEIRSLKLNCYWYFFLSFLYYRLRLKKVFKIKNQMTGKI